MDKERKKALLDMIADLPWKAANSGYYGIRNDDLQSALQQEYKKRFGQEMDGSTLLDCKELFEQYCSATLSKTLRKNPREGLVASIYVGRSMVDAIMPTLLDEIIAEKRDNQQERQELLGKRYTRLHCADVDKDAVEKSAYEDTEFLRNPALRSRDALDRIWERNLDEYRMVRRRVLLDYTHLEEDGLVPNARMRELMEKRKREQASAAVEKDAQAAGEISCDLENLVRVSHLQAEAPPDPTVRIGIKGVSSPAADPSIRRA